MKLQVEHYRTATGKIPYLQWLTKLKDRTAKAAVIRRSIRIELGDLGDHKSVGDGVWELRIDVGPGYRVYYGMAGKTVVLLLTAGDKGSQSRDIARAKDFWNDYQYRQSEDQGQVKGGRQRFARGRDGCDVPRRS